jgi:hypothetical protein
MSNRLSRIGIKFSLKSLLRPVNEKVLFPRNIKLVQETNTKRSVYPKETSFYPNFFVSPQPAFPGLRSPSHHGKRRNPERLSQPNSCLKQRNDTAVTLCGSSIRQLVVYLETLQYGMNDINDHGWY